MGAEALKLGLITRLIKIQEVSTLQRMEELITQAEMETRSNESLEAIHNKEITSIDEFGKENEQWLKKKYTK